MEQSQTIKKEKITRYRAGATERSEIKYQPP